MKREWEKIWAEVGVRGTDSLDRNVTLTQDAQPAFDALLAFGKDPDHPISTGSLVTTNKYVLLHAKVLGITDLEQISTIRTLAAEAGLALCPFEFAFEARWGYQTQPEGEQVLVMSPDIDVNGHAVLFVLSMAGGYEIIETIDGDNGPDDPGELINPEALLLFQVA